MRRIFPAAALIGLLAIALAIVSVPAQPGAAAPVPGLDVTYTLDADFDQGILANVNHDTPNNDQLQLNTTASTFPFVWVALSQRCTIAKLDTNTGAILGEYRTVSDGAPCYESSRTTVALDGSVWVGHRGPGGVTHVGHEDLFQCVDRDGSTSIDTSTGYGDVKPWPGATSILADAVDECIIHHVDTVAAGLSDSRHMSIDDTNNLWVGDFSGGSKFVKIDGNTGTVISAVSDWGCGGYGGLIDANGVIWSGYGGSSGLLRWDPNAPTVTPNADLPGANPRCFGIPSYGVAIDPSGWVWTSGLSANTLRKVSPDGLTVLGPFATGGIAPQGLAVTSNGDVWLSSNLFCSGAGCPIGHHKNSGLHIGNVPNPTGGGSTGVSVDANGKVWTVNRNANTATRIDPTLGPLGSDAATPVGAVDLTVSFPAGPDGRPLPYPYNYSDMTGTQLLTSTAPQGTWTVVQDGGSAGVNWGTITWNTEPEGSVPPGTSITVEARASDTEVGLGSETYIAVSDNVPFSLTGRYIQVRATLKPDSAGVSPVMSDLRIKSLGGLTEFEDPLVDDSCNVQNIVYEALPPSGTPNGVYTGPLGLFMPTVGPDFVILTTGDFNLADDPNSSGSSGANLGGPNVRGDTDYDVTILRIDCLPGETANCLSVDFAFYSEEYPEYVGSAFNDAFIAELNTSSWTTSGSVITAPDNFAFDSLGNPVSINSTGATSMNPANAAGTTYDGATTLLLAEQTFAPNVDLNGALPGNISLYLSIFDQGDRILDSAVFLDNVTVGTVSDEEDCEPGATPQNEADFEKVSMTIDGPAEIDVSEDVVITVTSVVANNGPDGATASDTLSVSPPFDCTVDPAEYTDQVTLEPEAQQTITHTFTIHCFERSNHVFVVCNTIEATDAQDTDPENNVLCVDYTVAAFEETDVKATAITVDAPANAVAGVPFDVEIDVTVHNNGPITAVDGEGGIGLAVPPGCTADPNVPYQLVNPISNMMASVSQVITKSWQVTCDFPGIYNFVACGRAGPLTLHVRDSETTNNFIWTPFTVEVDADGTDPDAGRCSILGDPPEECDNGIDDDGDTFVDEEPDTDHDGASDCVDPDDDGDGYSDVSEQFLGTDTIDACPDSTLDAALPPDLNNSRSVNIQDVLAIKQSVGSAQGQTAYVKRHDLNASGNINISDILALKGPFGSSCTG
ncbi:MAG: choice-of-anchor L domain-containing protein [Dehalococcoidia bacterium]